MFAIDAVSTGEQGMQRPRGIATKAFEAYGFRESECGGVALARARCTNRSVGRQTVLSCVRCCALWHRLRVRDFGWCGDWGVVIVECVIVWCRGGGAWISG